MSVSKDMQWLSSSKYASLNIDVKFGKNGPSYLS